MLPIRDVIPTRTAPGVTIALIVLMAFLAIVRSRLPDDTFRLLILTYGLIPSQWSWVTPASSMFLHVSLVHAATNLTALWLFGSTIEDRLGHTRYLVFYLTAGYAGAVMQRWLDPGSTTAVIGAGAAVAGIIGGYLALFPRSRVLLLVPLWGSVDLVEVPMWLLPGFWVLAQALSGPVTGDLFGVVTGTSIWSMASGAIVGALTVWMLRLPARQRVEWWAD